jgi:hypothetical protein
MANNKNKQEVAILNAECLQKTLKEILKDRTKFDRDYSIINFGYLDKDGNIKKLRLKELKTSDTYANVEFLFEDITEKDVDTLVLREQFNRNLEKIDKVFKANTEEIKIKDGKIIEHRK